MGGGRFGGFLVSGKLEGLFRFKFFGCCSMGFLGDKFFGVYCGGGFVWYNIWWVIEGNDRRNEKCVC